MILAIKTDFDPVEIYVLSDLGDVLRKKKWSAGRTLARNLLDELKTIVKDSFNQSTGLVVFLGPGSFTGLRIGATIANAIAYSENIPIVGEGDSNWLKNGVKRLKNGENDKIVVPNYGREANITKPKK